MNYPLTERPPGLMRRPGRPPEFTDGDVLELVAVLHESSALYSGRSYAKRSTAHCNAERLAARLREYEGVNVEIQTYKDTVRGGYTWCIGLVR